MTVGKAHEWWTDEGWANHGSKLQIQLYVNRQREALNQAIGEVFPDLRSRSIEWRAPIEEAGFAEPKDRAFLRAIGAEHLAEELSAFWPPGGPVWDALAVVDEGGAILVEAKGHPKEVYGGGTQASATSRIKIADAIRETQRSLEREEDAEAWMDALRPLERGHSALYQSANRYAHLYWLRKMGIEAWLVHVLFVDDRTHMATSRAEWEEALPMIERDLGLTGIPVPFAAHVFLLGLIPNDIL
jgi:hypothetical protein